MNDVLETETLFWKLLLYSVSGGFTFTAPIWG